MLARIPRVEVFIREWVAHSQTSRLLSGYLYKFQLVALTSWCAWNCKPTFGSAVRS